MVSSSLGGTSTYRGAFLCCFHPKALGAPMGGIIPCSLLCNIPQRALPTILKPL